MSLIKCYWMLQKPRVQLSPALTRNLEIENTLVLVLPNTWTLESVKDTKFGTTVSNKILLNAVKTQGYSFYRFWVITRKPRVRGEVGGGGGRFKIIPSPTKIKVKLNFGSWTNSNMQNLMTMFMFSIFWLEIPFFGSIWSKRSKLSI